MFSPLAFPTGMILYDLTFSVPPTSHLELFPFEIHREPLVVIAVADGVELNGGNEQKIEESTFKGKNEASPTPAGLDQLRQELELLRERNPKALVHQLLIFDYEEVGKLLNGPDDILWIPRPEASKATTMKTVLCDITSLLLSELDGFARTMQSIPSIESPTAFSWGPHRGPDIRPRPTDTPTVVGQAMTDVAKSALLKPSGWVVCGDVLPIDNALRRAFWWPSIALGAQDMGRFHGRRRRLLLLFKVKHGLGPEPEPMQTSFPRPVTTQAEIVLPFPASQTTLMQFILDTRFPATVA